MLLLASDFSFIPFIVSPMQNNSIEEINQTFDKIKKLIEYIYNFLLNKGINMTIPEFEKINEASEIVSKVNANFDKLNDFLIALNNELSQINIKAEELNIDNLQFKTLYISGKINIKEDSVNITINDKEATITPVEVKTANGSIDLWHLI